MRGTYSWLICPQEIKMQKRETNDSNWPTILCIDDEPSVVDSIARQLHKYAVHVKKALNGMQGIWMASTENADLVITDLQMPFANGIEVTEVMQQVPVIAVTGVQDPEVEAKLIKAGAVAVLFKPIDSNHLVTEIKKLIPLQLKSTKLQTSHE